MTNFFLPTFTRDAAEHYNFTRLKILKTFFLPFIEWRCCRALYLSLKSISRQLHVTRAARIQFRNSNFPKGDRGASRYTEQNWSLKVIFRSRCRCNFSTTAPFRTLRLWWTFLPEVNFLVPKVCRFEKKIPIWSKFSDLQKWANWPAQAGSKKWAENQETFRLRRNFPISQKLAELTSKKLTSGKEFNGQLE